MVKSADYYEEEEDFAIGVFGTEEEWYDEEESLGSDGKTLQPEEESTQAEAFLVEQFGSMEEAENFAEETYGSASRTLDEARKLVNEVKKARGYFPIVGIGCYDDGFNSLPGNRSLSAPRGRGASRGGRKGGRSRGSSSGSNPAGKGTLGVTPPARASQQPAAKLRKGGTGTAQRGGPHHANSVTKQCFLCNKMGHFARDCPDRGAGGNKRAFGAGAH